MRKTSSNAFASYREETQATTGDALGHFVGHNPASVDEYKSLVKFVKLVVGYVDDLLLPKLDDEPRKQAEGVLKVVRPFLKGFDEITRHSAWDRMSAAGAQLMTWFAVACELHRDWRNDVEGLGTLFSNHIPDYRNLITAYTATQTANRVSRVA